MMNLMKEIYFTYKDKKKKTRQKLKLINPHPNYREKQNNHLKNMFMARTTQMNSYYYQLLSLNINVLTLIKFILRTFL